jgi:hypothetical protein
MFHVKHSDPGITIDATARGHAHEHALSYAANRGDRGDRNDAKCFT